MIGCVSGSPKRTLNSSTFGPFLRDHEPGVEDALVGAAVAVGRVGDGHEDVALDLPHAGAR